MLRSLASVTKSLSILAITTPRLPLQNAISQRFATRMFRRDFSFLLGLKTPPTFLNNATAPGRILNYVNTRTVTKFSMRKGKRKSVKPVLKRFYRLNWGIWIRRIAGCHKRMWKKSPPRRRRLRQHVFCNSTQSFMLDKMVGSYWRKPKYYVDDPYNPYHTREEFKFTYQKPKPYFPPE